MLVICIRKVPSRNFGRETSCPYISVVFLSPCGGYRDATLNLRQKWFPPLPLHIIVNKLWYYSRPYSYSCRSQSPRGLRRGSTAARLLGLPVPIPPGAWMSDVGAALSVRGLCVGLINRPEEFYRVWCVWVWWWSLDHGEALAH